MSPVESVNKNKFCICGEINPKMTPEFSQTVFTESQVKHLSILMMKTKKFTSVCLQCWVQNISTFCSCAFLFFFSCVVTLIYSACVDGLRHTGTTVSLPGPFDFFRSRHLSVFAGLTSFPLPASFWSLSFLALLSGAAVVGGGGTGQFVILVGLACFSFSKLAKISA